MQAVVDRFNQSQSRSWVVRVPIADITSKVMVAIAGGDPPDIAGLFSYSIPQLAAANAAIPMAEFSSTGSASIRRSTPPPSCASTINNQQWAGVNTCYTLALYYNKAVFLRERARSQPTTSNDLAARFRFRRAAHTTRRRRSPHPCRLPA